ncbi:MAG TPA: HAMP domain-containing sensor histidine kinase [Turneriella sp.]|nr:HAMP domain-containing sensor histidine kinase [Turneriella sp.]
MSDVQRKNLSRISLFSGSTLLKAFSMLSVIGLLFWWQHLIERNLENQYNFFAKEISAGTVSNALRELIEKQDRTLAAQIFSTPKSNSVNSTSIQIIHARLLNRQNMLFYEQSFFILLLLSGHFFFVYIYFREHRKRKQIEQTILLATHELRQPLQSLSLALEAVHPKATEKTQAALELGLNDIHRLGELVRYLAGAFATKKDTSFFLITNLETFIENFIETSFSSVKKRIRTDTKASPSFRLNIAAERLHFLFRNLTENALKYAKDTIQIHAKLEEKYFIFSVMNSGASIDSNSFKKIGSAFYRATSVEVQNKTGFGLGLYLSGLIARQAGGTLTIENTKEGITRTILKLRRYRA